MSKYVTIFMFGMPNLNIASSPLKIRHQLVPGRKKTAHTKPTKSWQTFLQKMNYLRLEIDLKEMQSCFFKGFLMMEKKRVSLVTFAHALAKEM